MASHQKTLPGTLSIPNLLIGEKRQGEISLLITIWEAWGLCQAKFWPQGFYHQCYSLDHYLNRQKMLKFLASSPENREIMKTPREPLEAKGKVEKSEAPEDAGCRVP